jgi:uncharacterized RDD family membrane protein YckC
MAENPFLSANTEVEAASRWSRLAARLLDGLAFLAPLPLLVVPCLGALVALLAWAALLIGQVWLLVTRGQTLGKKAMDIYIMRSDGGLPHVGWLLLREFAIPAAVGILRYAGHQDPSPVGQAFQGLLGFVWLIDALFIFSPTRRCLHDLVAGTHVVKLG